MTLMPTILDLFQRDTHNLVSYSILLSFPCHPYVLIKCSNFQINLMELIDSRCRSIHYMWHRNPSIISYIELESSIWILNQTIRGTFWKKSHTVQPSTTLIHVLCLQTWQQREMERWSQWTNLDWFPNILEYHKY